MRNTEKCLSEDPNLGVRRVFYMIPFRCVVIWNQVGNTSLCSSSTGCLDVITPLEDSKAKKTDLEGCGSPKHHAHETAAISRGEFARESCIRPRMLSGAGILSLVRNFGASSIYTSIYTYIEDGAPSP
jgi:hypothetical protein